MSPQILDAISIPLIAGVVGYVTNKLAIKMLFRPLKPKWYSLGWQGIVPRSRTKLASLIGNMVAKRLLSPDDIASSVFKNEFSANMSKYIAEKLSQTTPCHIEKIADGFDFERLLVENRESIDVFAQKLITQTINRYLNSRLPIEKITDFLRNQAQNGDMAAQISEKLALFIKNKLNSEEKLSDILPSSILSLEGNAVKALTEKTAGMIKNMGRSIAVKEAAAKKIVDFKNNFFAGNGTMDFIKMGFINMMLNDEAISNAVKRELPGIMDGIADDVNVRQKISDGIKDEIHNLLSSPVCEINKKISQNVLKGEDFASSIKSPQVKTFINKSLSSIIDGYELKYKNITVGETLKGFGFDIDSVIKDFSLSNILLPDIKRLKETFCVKISGYVSTSSDALAANITEKVEILLRDSLPYVLKNADIAGSVEAKINAMPLDEVENVLFSFMKDHFIWINRLGFILGFLIGAAQVTAMYFIH